MTKYRAILRPFICLAGLGLPLAVSGTATAQINNNPSGMITGNNGASARPVVGSNPDSALPPKLPRAGGLPGAQSDPDSVAPADRPASEMRPTEALFDAINRGDIAAARDAINRGAELNGRNLLGTTPLELSVDLSRRDITFLLLSLRGMDEASSSRPARPSTPADDAKREREAKLQAQRDAQRTEAARRAAARVAPPTGPAVPQGQAPRLFAGDGGAPVPDAGFLGFGGATNGRTR